MLEFRQEIYPFLELIMSSFKNIDCEKKDYDCLFEAEAMVASVIAERM